MKRPSKKSIDHLRIAVGMSGIAAISNGMAELILVTQAEMERLGGKYSLKDAARVAAFVEKNNKPKEK